MFCQALLACDGMYTITGFDWVLIGSGHQFFAFAANTIVERFKVAVLDRIANLFILLQERQKHQHLFLNFFFVFLAFVCLGGVYVNLNVKKLLPKIFTTKHSQRMHKLYFWVLHIYCPHQFCLNASKRGLV